MMPFAQARQTEKVTVAAPEQPYLDLLTRILDTVIDKGDRTGTGTSVFGHPMRFDLSAGFPLLTTKKVHFRSIMVELHWFLGATRTSGGCGSSSPLSAGPPTAHLPLTAAAEQLYLIAEAAGLGASDDSVLSPSES